MSEFSAGHWAIAGVVFAALLYGAWHLGKALIRWVSWLREK